MNEYQLAKDMNNTIVSAAWEKARQMSKKHDCKTKMTVNSEGS